MFLLTVGLLLLLHYSNSGNKILCNILFQGTVRASSVLVHTGMADRHF